jgi:hypothetical protein
VENREQGSISAFVVCLLFGLTALVGLVFDGGRVVTEYADISDIAENASRIGCQQISGIRVGTPYVDKTRAAMEISNFLNSHGVHGEVKVFGGGASVTIQKVVSMKLLSLIGIRNRTITITRSANVVSG